MADSCLYKIREDKDLEFQVDIEQLRDMVAECAYLQFRNASRQVSGVFDKVFLKLDIRPNQYGIVAHVVLNPGICQSRLADLLGLERSSLSREIKHVISRNFVRTEAGEDLRSRLLYPTASGIQMIRKGIPLMEDAQKIVIQYIGEENWKDLNQNLSRISSIRRAQV